MAAIVGVFFVEHSEPKKITSIPKFCNESGETIYEKHLHVNVTPSAAIEFQHFLTFLKLCYEMRNRDLIKLLED